MHVAGLCSICGEPAGRMHTCKLCGRIVCVKCARDDICVECLGRRIPELAKGRGLR
jgi:hypothetical protein